MPGADDLDDPLGFAESMGIDVLSTEGLDVGEAPENTAEEDGT